MANVELLKKLIGTWEGEGICQYPPNVPVTPYLEQLTIRQAAKPTVFEYRSSTQHATTGNTLHVETGFIRCPPNTNLVEMVVSHPFGLAEISEGSVKNGSMELDTSDGKGIIRVSTTKGNRTTQLVRRYKLVDDCLEFSMDMATNVHDLQNHLVSRLKRVV